MEGFIVVKEPQFMLRRNKTNQYQVFSVKLSFMGKMSENKKRENATSRPIVYFYVIKKNKSINQNTNYWTILCYRVAN